MSRFMPSNTVLVTRPKASFVVLRLPDVSYESVVKSFKASCVTCSRRWLSYDRLVVWFKGSVTLCRSPLDQTRVVIWLSAATAIPPSERAQGDFASCGTGLP